MSAQALLDQLLRQGMSLLKGQGVPGQAPVPQAPAPRSPQAPNPKPGTDWGTFGAGAATGAAATGALGLLLGSKQARRYAGKAMKYGSLAAVGMMAYRAYTNWQSQQAATQGQAAPAGQPPATPPLALPAPRTIDRVPAPEAEQHSRAMLVAMVAASKADGHLDARERGLLEAELGRLAAEPALHQWLEAELQRPLDPAEVARAASTPELAAEMYLASLLVADDQSFMERAYLDELARQLRLPEGLKTQLEAQANAA